VPERNRGHRGIPVDFQFSLKKIIGKDEFLLFRMVKNAGFSRSYA
jgi:hypothetical protein